MFIVRLVQHSQPPQQQPRNQSWLSSSVAFDTSISPTPVSRFQRQRKRVPPPQKKREKRKENSKPPRFALVGQLKFTPSNCITEKAGSDPVDMFWVVFRRCWFSTAVFIFGALLNSSCAASLRLMQYLLVIPENTLFLERQCRDAIFMSPTVVLSRYRCNPKVVSMLATRRNANVGTWVTKIEQLFGLRRTGTPLVCAPHMLVATCMCRWVPTRRYAFRRAGPCLRN